MITNVDDLVGSPSAQPQGVFINAEKIQGVPVDNTSIADGKALVYNSTSQKLVYGDVANSGAVKSVNGKTGDVTITKSDVGLGNVLNVASYSITETNNIVNTKVNKVEGKELSDNNYTDIDKAKVDLIITDNIGNKFLSDDGSYKDVTVTSGVQSINGYTGVVEITKSDVGLGNVENLAPLDMPISNDTQTALNNKVDKVVGLGLSENNLTNSLKSSYDSAVGNSHTHTNKTLLDTITNTGDGTKYLSDNGTYKTVQGGSGAETFLQLTDTPISYDNEVGKFVRVKIDGTGLEFANIGGGGEGVDSFLELTDTPNTYIGKANKVLSVNSTESSIEFTDLVIPSKTSDLTNDSNFVTDNNYVHTDNNYTTLEKTKLSGIEANANYYVLPNNVVIDDNYIRTDNNYTNLEKTKLGGIEEGANNYVLPSNVVIDNNYVHTDTNYTQAEKTKLSGIMDGAELNVQADWNTTDVNADSFIKNKPTIPTAIDTFLELTDTPTSYSGNADKMVAVNSTGTGLTFVDGGGFTPIQMYKSITGIASFVSLTDNQARSGANVGIFPNYASINLGGIYLTKLSPTLYDLSYNFNMNIANVNITTTAEYTISYTLETGLGATFSSVLNRKLPTESKNQYQTGNCFCSQGTFNGEFYIANGKIYAKHRLFNTYPATKSTFNLGLNPTSEYLVFSGRMLIDIGTGDLKPLAL